MQMEAGLEGVRAGPWVGGNVQLVECLERAGGPWGTRGQGPLQPNSGQCCQDWWVSELWTGPEGVSHSAGKGMRMFPIKHFWLPGFFWLSLALASSLFPLNVFSGESFRCHVHGLLFPHQLPLLYPHSFCSMLLGSVFLRNSDNS